MVRAVTLELASDSLGFPRFGASGTKPLPSDIQHSVDCELTQDPGDHVSRYTIVQLPRRR